MRILKASVAAALTATLALGAAPAAGAQTLSSPTALSSQVNVPVPGQVLPGDSVAKRLQAATDRHLADMGHTRNGEAEFIANAWAAQAAAGQVEFKAGSGKGTIFDNRGEGQVYRFTSADAEARIAWLDREANTAGERHGFGTAVIQQGDTVYLAEFFLGA